MRPGRHDRQASNSQREKSAKTRVRVAAAGSRVAAALVDLVLRRAQEELMESHWFLSAPPHCRYLPPEVTLLEISHFEVFSSMGLLDAGSDLSPYVVAQATVGGLTARFRVRLEVGRNVTVVMDETPAA